MLQLDLTKRYTYADYLTWFDEGRRELLGGFVKLMTPAPKRIHQELSGNLDFAFRKFLKKKKCKIYNAPFDVRLPNNGETANDKIYTVVQPDLSIICDLAKLDDRGCLGAPDMIIEIVSHNNSKHDVETKFQLYQKHGVREYWIVFPYEKTVNVFTLNDKNKYELVGMFAGDSKVTVNIFAGELEIDLAEIFEDVNF